MGADIRAGGAYLELFIKGNVEKSLKDTEKKLKAFGSSISSIGKSMAGLGGAIVAPLALAGERFASMGDELNKASQRTGVGVESLGKLKYAAEQSGASFEDVESGIRKMSKAIFEARDGSAGAQKSLASIGISAKQLEGLSPDEQFKKIAENLNQVDDAGTKAALAMEIFGKGGATLLPLMSEGAAGIDALGQRATELGLIFGGEDAEAATKFGDILDDLWKQLQAVTFQAGAAVAQALQPFAEAATNVLKSVIDWTRENRSLVIAVLGLGVALVAAGAGLIALGAAFSAVGSVISGVTATFGLVGSAITLLLNPVVLVGVGLVALAAYFVSTSEAGGEMADFLKDKFSVLQATAEEAFGGIADALKAGDIVLAAQILWTGLQAAWLEGTQELQAKWSEFRGLFVQTAAAAFYGAASLGVKAFVSIESAWEKSTSAMGSLLNAVAANFGDLWDSITSSISNGWNKTIQVATHGLNYLKGLYDKSFDVGAADKAADELFAKQKSNADSLAASNKTARDKALTDDSVKRDAELKSKLAGLEQAKDAAVAALNKAESDIDAGAAAQSQEEVAALATKKADLEKQLADLRGKSAGEKIDKQVISDLDAFFPTGLPKKSAENVFEDRKALDIKSAGIFNAAALQSLAGGTVQDRIAAASEATAANTKKIAGQGPAKFK